MFLLIRLGRPREVRFIVHTFDSRLPQIRPRSKVLSVPIYRTPKYVVREAISSFDSKVNSQILQLLPRRMDKTEEKVQTIFSSREKELDDLLEDIILEFTKPIRAEGVAGYSEDRPICIILPKVAGDSYVYAIALTCRELYRIRKGGKPIPRWISEGSKDEIERFLKAGDRIFVIDDSRSKILPLDEKVKSSNDLFERVDKAKLFDRLRDLFSQDYGFIIFHLSSQWVSDFAELLKKEVGYQIPKLVMLEPQPLPTSVKRELSSVCWGFVKIENWSEFDEFFGAAEKTYYERLDSILNDVELKHYVKFDDAEGKEHKALKMMAVIALAKEMGAKSRQEIINMLEEGKIKTEYEFEFGRADVFAEHEGKQIFVEIETFYGTGDPIEKLDSEKPDGSLGTLRKYIKYVNELDRENVKVIIVVLGLHMLLFAKSLLKLRIIYRTKYGIDVDFYAIDVENKRFISLKEYLKRLKKLKEKAYDEIMVREVTEP